MCCHQTKRVISCELHLVMHICTTIAIVWENTLSLCMQILTMEWTYFFKSNATSIRYCLVLHSLYILPKTFICHFRVPTWQYSCVLAPSTNKFPSELNWALPEKKGWNAGEMHQVPLVRWHDLYYSSKTICHLMWISFRRNPGGIHTPYILQWLSARLQYLHC